MVSIGRFVRMGGRGGTPEIQGQMNISENIQKHVKTVKLMNLQQFYTLQLKPKAAFLSYVEYLRCVAKIALLFLY